VQVLLRDGHWSWTILDVVFGFWEQLARFCGDRWRNRGYVNWFARARGVCVSLSCVFGFSTFDDKCMQEFVLFEVGFRLAIASWQSKNPAIPQVACLEIVFCWCCLALRKHYYYVRTFLVNKWTILPATIKNCCCSWFYPCFSRAAVLVSWFRPELSQRIAPSQAARASLVFSKIPRSHPIFLMFWRIHRKCSSFLEFLSKIYHLRVFTAALLVFRFLCAHT